jgi:hypothetical protein
VFVTWGISLSPAKTQQASQTNYRIQAFQPQPGAAPIDTNAPAQTAHRHAADLHGFAQEQGVQVNSKPAQKLGVRKFLWGPRDFPAAMGAGVRRVTRRALESRLSVCMDARRFSRHHVYRHEKTFATISHVAREGEMKQYCGWGKFFWYVDLCVCLFIYIYLSIFIFIFNLIFIFILFY